MVSSSNRLFFLVLSIRLQHRLRQSGKKRFVEEMIATRILYVYWKIVGLCPYGLTNRGNIRISYVGAGYAMILSLVYFFGDLSTMNDFIAMNMKQRTPMSKISSVCGHVVESLLIVTVWVWFAVNQIRLRELQRSFIKIMDDRDFFGIRIVHHNTMRRTQYLAIVCNFLWFCLYISCMLDGLWPVSAFVSVFCSLVHLVPPNFIFFYIGVMVTIRDHFRTFNGKLREICERVDRTDTGVVQPIRSTISARSGSEALVASNLLEALGRVHTEMIDLARSVVDFLSPVLYLTVIGHLVQFSSIIYIVCFAASNGILWERENNFSYIRNSIWFVIHIIGIITEIVIADSVTYEANKAGDLLHEILALRPTTRSTVSAKMWSLRLFQNPLRIKLFGMIEMKYSVVYKLCSISVSYVTIMIQLDQLKHQENLTETSIY